MPTNVILPYEILKIIVMETCGWRRGGRRAQIPILSTAYPIHVYHVKQNQMETEKDRIFRKHRKVMSGERYSLGALGMQEQLRIWQTKVEVQSAGF